jgi:hypothetical protein
MSEELDIIAKRPEEDLFSYSLRLGENRQLYGLDWKTVGTLLNESSGEEYTESRWRKLISAYLEAYNHFEKSNLGIQKFEEKRREEKKERIKLQSVRADYNRVIREQSRRELLADLVKDSIETIPLPHFQPLQEIKHNHREGVLNFGDIHFGKEFKSINNEYNISIVEERLHKLLEETIDIIHKEGFSKIKVLNLGDSIDGMCLRISQLQTLQIGITDQVIQFSKLISAWLNELTTYVEIEYIHCPSANHTEIRPFSTKRSQFPAEDMERLIQQLVFESLKNNPRFHMNINESGIIPFKIAGFNVIALHGHQLKNKKNSIKDLSALYHKEFTYLFMGHLHSSETITVGANQFGNCEILQVNSIQGSDTYSDSLGLASKAGAAFDVFEEGKGHTIHYYITLN